MADKVYFRSDELRDLEIVIRPGQFVIGPDGLPFKREGRSVQFVGGYLAVDADDKEALKAVRKSSLYGAKVFEMTGKPAPPKEDVGALKRRIAELEAKLEEEEPKEQSKETPLQRLNALKKQAKELGIEAERGWSAEDYKKAIEKHGAQ